MGLQCCKVCGGSYPFALLRFGNLAILEIWLCFL
jgi:hypothetical protein